MPHWSIPRVRVQCLGWATKVQKDQGSQGGIRTRTKIEKLFSLVKDRHIKTCNMSKNHTVTTILQTAEIPTVTCDDLQMERLIDLTPLDNGGCKGVKCLSELNKKISKSGNIPGGKGAALLPTQETSLGCPRQCSKVINYCTD
ncbi:hypothetical protein M0657_004700 [Pyricularia oryzae]|uniref:Uncharacterized protein n=1 Tax=Pyricularia oryzae TaxID=318829 RepID=A0A4P7N2D0_PYROR|nr:hypothetical protein M9X92_005095 [Pyricularia oryzae]KAI7924355.1 hypothetical protein M0657_004700 [Pyricularia oryzae]QBZ56443.1 hypothetical protein PoMZ_01350 [Pyricularia oryzae]